MSYFFNHTYNNFPTISHSKKNLMNVYRELRLESDDLGNTHNLTDACAISKRFVTSYYKYVDGAVKTLFSANAEQMPPGGDLRRFDFSSLTGESNGEAADIKRLAGSEVIDATVNSMITCKYGPVSFLQ